MFVEKLAKLCDENAIIITDCGSNLIWTMQAFKIRTGQRLISAFNHSPMGYSLPASIGASISKSDNQIVCIIGDGGLQVNVQELGVIHRNKLNIKIFVLNNHCHGIIQGTQDNWLGGRHHASSPSTGKLPDCNVDAISEAYGLKSLSINTNAQLEAVLSEILMTPEGFVCNVHLSDGAQIFPKLLYGRPIEDSHPLLPRDEFHRNMIVAPIT